MILKPISPLPPTSKDMKMMTVPCILYDSDTSCPPLAHFRNHENNDSPMHSFLMIVEPTAPLPGTSKTMKMMTVLCISYAHAANRPTPRHFQNNENDNSPPMNFL